MTISLLVYNYLWSFTLVFCCFTFTYRSYKNFPSFSKAEIVPEILSTHFHPTIVCFLFLLPFIFFNFGCHTWHYLGVISGLVLWSHS